MKILLVSLNYAPEQTGIGKYQGEMAEWLAGRGHEVRAIVAPPYYPHWKIGAGYKAYAYKTEDIHGVRVTRVPVFVPSKIGAIKRLIHLASFCFFSFSVVLWQAAFWRPQAILLTAPPIMAVPGILLAALLSGARTHLHVQDFEVEAAFDLGLFKRNTLYGMALWLEAHALRGFDNVSTISKMMLKKLGEKGVKQEKTFLIPNWANIDDFDPVYGPGKWPELLRPTPQTVLVLYSGNLGRKQGLETIIEAAHLLKDEPHIRFVISGDGVGRSKMQKSAVGLNNIVFLPVQPTEDFRHLMIAADIHLLPQRKRAADLFMPSKLGNILASGRPVVAGAEKETQIFDAVPGCGLIVPAEDARAFADAIKKLAADASLRDQMGQEGRKRAKEEWSKENALGALERHLLSQSIA